MLLVEAFLLSADDETRRWALSQTLQCEALIRLYDLQQKNKQYVPDYCNRQCVLMSLTIAGRCAERARSCMSARAISSISIYMYIHMCQAVYLLPA